MKIASYTLQAMCYYISFELIDSDKSGVISYGELIKKLKESLSTDLNENERILIAKLIIEEGTSIIDQ